MFRSSPASTPTSIHQPARVDQGPVDMRELWGTTKQGRYSQDAIEFGIELMSHNVGAQTAKEFIRTFMNRLYPGSVEGTDYRLPTIAQLKRWRRFLEPISHFISLSAMDKADMIHLLSDACTKRQVGVFHINAKLEVRGEDGGTKTQFIPVKFKVTRNGTASVEAEAVMESLDTEFADLRCYLKSPEDRFLSVVSSSSDNANAAKKVSDILETKKHKIFDDLLGVYGPDHSRLTGVLRELHKLTCTNHTNNFVGEAWWAEGRGTIMRLIRRENAARILQAVVRARVLFPRDGLCAYTHDPNDPWVVTAEKSGKALYISEARDRFVDTKDASAEDGVEGSVHNVDNIVHAASKLFAEGGDLFDYFLNESREFKTFKEEKTRDAVEANLPLPVFEDLRLPPVKGSRALIVGSICFRLGLNLDAYDRYLLQHSSQPKKKEDSSTVEANRLVKTMLHGLRDRFVVLYILHAGMYTACVADPVVFIMNVLVDRPQVWEVWGVVAAVVADLTVPLMTDAKVGNNWRGINPEAEHLMKRAILKLHPEWTLRYEAWEKKTKRQPPVDRFMAMCRDPSRVSFMAEFAFPAGVRSRDKILLHRGKNCAGIDALKNAPVNTDTTEGGIGHLDYVLYRYSPNHTHVPLSGMPRYNPPPVVRPPPTSRVLPPDHSATSAPLSGLWGPSGCRYSRRKRRRLNGPTKKRSRPTTCSRLTSGT